jgi:hypothetical protein
MLVLPSGSHVEQYVHTQQPALLLHESLVMNNNHAAASDRRAIAKPEGGAEVPGICACTDSGSAAYLSDVLCQAPHAAVMMVFCSSCPIASLLWCCSCKTESQDKSAQPKI